MTGFAYVCTILGSIFGGLVLFGAIIGTNSAPQQAAGAAIAVALAVIPYCMARSFEYFGQGRQQRQRAEARVEHQESREIAKPKAGVYDLSR